MKYRFIYAGLALLAVGVIAAGMALAPSGRTTPLPAGIEAIFPRPGDQVIGQTVIEVDVAPTFAAEIFVDGFRVPDTEIQHVAATGVYRRSPGPLSAYMTAWSPGSHTVRVVVQTVTGPVQRSEFTWTFRVS